ncbi:DUF6037 family protein [Paenibacillus doosanensis]|uniref:DUF6037 family protein n=1 Tax=Paenibacillus doosanensis TaxID=1229154 RepID=UPI00217F8922|nr:DUF6037 family protein [Paenibacillus doosanensis]MCS7465006.1 DUF6037 family protein [Paenibacillus doosanensis]
MGVYRKDVEEADKIYFMGWLDKTISGNKATPNNLEKTRLLLGQDAYVRCKAKNVSSRWTDDVKKAQFNDLTNQRIYIVRTMHGLT